MIFCASLKLSGRNKRAQSDPTLCCHSIKLKQYRNESLLGKWHVCIAAYVLEATNLLLWLQTSRSLFNTPPDTHKHYAEWTHLGYTLGRFFLVSTMNSLGRVRLTTNYTEKHQCQSATDSPLGCKQQSRRLAGVFGSGNKPYGKSKVAKWRSLGKIN